MATDRVRECAWELYQALHTLACSAIVGELETVVADGQLVSGDWHYAFAQCFEFLPDFAAVYPELAEQVGQAVEACRVDGPTRLDVVLPLLIPVNEVSGGALLPLPPG